jgi:hypothetical protein
LSWSSIRFSDHADLDELLRKDPASPQLTLTYPCGRLLLAREITFP